MVSILLTKSKSFSSFSNFSTNKYPGTCPGTTLPLIVDPPYFSSVCSCSEVFLFLLWPCHFWRVLIILSNTSQFGFVWCFLIMTEVIHLEPDCLRYHIVSFAVHCILSVLYHQCIIISDTDLDQLAKVVSSLCFYPWLLITIDYLFHIVRQQIMESRTGGQLRDHILWVPAFIVEHQKPQQGNY